MTSCIVFETVMASSSVTPVFGSSSSADQLNRHAVSPSSGDKGFIIASSIGQLPEQGFAFDPRLDLCNAFLIQGRQIASEKAGKEIRKRPAAARLRGTRDADATLHTARSLSSKARSDGETRDELLCLRGYGRLQESFWHHILVGDLRNVGRAPKTRFLRARTDCSVL
jgi:hypothetical protein